MLFHKNPPYLNTHERWTKCSCTANNVCDEPGRRVDETRTTQGETQALHTLKDENVQNMNCGMASARVGGKCKHNRRRHTAVRAQQREDRQRSTFRIFL